MNGPARATALAGRAAHDVLSSLRFFTRLPLPTRETGPPDWARIAWSAPLAGAIVGAIGGLALVVSDELSFPPFLAATFAIAALVLTTGALHEDGLADVADGFGGGSTREAKLAIMRDSRIGVFGAIALVLSLMLRVGALAALQREGTGFAFAGLVLANAAARSGALTPLAWLPPARLDGAGASAGRLDSAHLVAAALSAVARRFRDRTVVAGGHPRLVCMRHRGRIRTRALRAGAAPDRRPDRRCRRRGRATQRSREPVRPSHRRAGRLNQDHEFPCHRPRDALRKSLRRRPPQRPLHRLRPYDRGNFALA